ncbi:sterol desaturase [Exidia glandulosa HHB12029]|uniref:Sterol desaturase n=1 Tax=Exidia glandulosa HHB12029 TaxID=1314781 RepID=A0A165MNJ3_EXIGL|nr:sterol desaturase [Exidia glandulosa HHB12029]
MLDNVARRWALLVDTHDHALIEFVGTQLVSVVFFWTLATTFLLLDTYLPEFSARHKLQDPGNSPSRYDVIACLRVVAQNQLMGTAALAGALYLSGKPGPFSFSPALPTWTELGRDLALCVLLREVLFYYSHRALHHRFVYAKVHKLHHRFTAPIALAAQYAHPIEHFVANIAPIAIPPQMLRVHIVTMWTFVALELVTATVVHSGYDFFAGVARMHDLHHEAFNVNFGSIGLLDRLHGTWSRKTPTRAAIKARVD